MIDKALLSLRPNAQWSLNGDDYEAIEWLDTNQTKPSKSEIDVEIARLQAEAQTNAYKAKRASEYPSIGDQLDALWKGGAEAEAMLAKVQAVKQKFPKGVA